MIVNSMYMNCTRAEAGLGMIMVESRSTDTPEEQLCIILRRLHLVLNALHVCVKDNADTYLSCKIVCLC